MTGTITSPVPGGSGNVAQAKSLLDEWLRFGEFLKRPSLPGTIAPASVGARGTMRMFALDLSIMIVIIAILISVVAAGIELPENLNSTLELNLTTVALIVIAAPVLEELAFRSWLSGKPGWLIAIGLFIAAGIVSAMFGMANTDSGAQAAVAFSVLLVLILAIVAIVALRKRAPVGWFRVIFPGMFWLSALAFALVHLLNYTEGTLAILLPLIIPQFVLGAILGYVRVHYGLWSAIVMHALHNGFALSIAAIAMEGGMG